MCICIYMYVCVYEYVYAHMHVYIHVYMRACMCIYKNAFKTTDKSHKRNVEQKQPDSGQLTVYGSKSSKQIELI